jgi:hypothetical protein
VRALEFSIIVAVFSDDDDSTSKTCLFVLIGWVVFELPPKAPLSELSALRFPKTKSEELVENNEPIVYVGTHHQHSGTVGTILDF